MRSSQRCHAPRRVARAIVTLAVALIAPSLQAQRVGTPAPEIELRTLAGAAFRLTALEGRPVVVTFWGTWCAPCRDEFPELVDVYRKHHDSGLEVIAVNQRDQELSTKEVQRFVDEFSVPFTVVLDLRGRSRRAYRLTGLPTTVFVDTAGMIRMIVPGPTSREQLAAGLATIGVTR